MKHYSLFMITAMLFLVIGMPAVAATECNKSYQVQIELTQAGATEKLTQVVWGSAPVINSSAGELRGELLAKDGSTITAFWIWDPRLQLGEHVVMDRNGTAKSSEGTTSRYATGDLVVILPRSPDAASFRLSDAGLKPLVTVNLAKAQNGLLFNCTKEEYVSTKPKNPGPVNPMDFSVLLGVGILVLVCAAGAGWFLMKKRKQP
jgi:hypothetical protein